MLSPLRNRFGIPGVISVIALVFAMMGGAYAASSNSGGGKATVSAKAKAGPRGPRGKTGKTGPAGPAGPAGAKGDTGAAGSNGTNGKDGALGAAGTNGTNGTNGTDGAAGTNGKTVLNGTVDPGTGVGTTGDFYINTTTEKIFGPKPSPAGAWPAGVELKGATGSPWTAGGTLPSTKTETGAWSYTKVSTAGSVIATASFPVPLAAPIAAGRAHYIYKTGNELFENSSTEVIEEVTPSSDCAGGTAEAPKAAAGSFCMYAGGQTGTLTSGIYLSSTNIGKPGSVNLLGGGATGTTGARLAFLLESGSSEGWGTWAVTAP